MSDLSPQFEVCQSMSSQRRPTSSLARSFVTAGGLISYGSDSIDPYRRADSSLGQRRRQFLEQFEPQGPPWCVSFAATPLPNCMTVRCSGWRGIDRRNEVHSITHNFQFCCSVGVIAASKQAILHMQRKLVVSVSLWCRSLTA